MKETIETEERAEFCSRKLVLPCVVNKAFASVKATPCFLLG